MKFLIIIILIFSTQLKASDEAVLGSFKVKVSAVKVSKKLYTDTPFAKKYQKLLSEEFPKGPNFANKYRIVRITCGEKCASVAVIDVELGVATESGLFIDGAQPWLKGDIIAFDRASSLMIMSGCLKNEPAKCGSHEYSWDGKAFKLEFFRPHD